MDKKKLLLPGLMLIIIPSIVVATGDITIVELIWVFFSIATGLFVLRSACLKLKNENKSSQVQANKYDLKKIKKAVYVSSLTGGIISIFTLLQADLSVPIKLLSIAGSIIFIIVIAQSILSYFNSSRSEI